MRIPAPFWRRWLAAALDLPRQELENAAAVARQGGDAGAGAAPPSCALWRPPSAAELRAVVAPGAGTDDLCTLAQEWAAGPPEEPTTQVWVAPPADGTDPVPERAHRLGALRRMDDLVGGLDLTSLVERELDTAVDRLAPLGDGPRAAQALSLLAQYAQLAGWVRGDAGDESGALRRYRAALWSAAAADDHRLAVHVLGCLSHQLLLAGATQEALLVARTTRTGAGAHARGHTGALLWHRLALASAHAGHRRAAHAALATAAECAADAEDEPAPPWLYWFDHDERQSMTGRCLATLGRPLWAARRLAGRSTGGPRAAALYGACLARCYLQVGEVEDATRLARRVLHDALRTGSARAAAGVHALAPLLHRHRDLPVVRKYTIVAADAAEYLPVTSAEGGNVSA